MKLENPQIVESMAHAITGIGKLLAFSEIEQEHVAMLLLRLEKHIQTIRRFEGLNLTPNIQTQTSALGEQVNKLEEMGYTNSQIAEIIGLSESIVKPKILVKEE